MAKKLSSKQAFESVWSGSRAAKIPEKTENRLLDAFTQFTLDKDREDVLAADLPELFRDYLGLDPRLLGYVKSGDFAMEEAPEYVDFERYLYNGALLLSVSDNLDVVDFYWHMVLANLAQKKQLGGAEKKRAHERRLYLRDIEQLMRNLKQGTTVEILMKMLATAGNGKTYVDYLDFAQTLGRIGELGS